MKKAIIILCILLIIAVSGCSSNQLNTPYANKSNDSGNTTQSKAITDIPFASSESVSPSSVPRNQDGEASQKNNNEIVSINGVISNYDAMKTFFPQINGLSDKTKQEKINDLIRNTALSNVQDDISLYRAFD